MAAAAAACVVRSQVLRPLLLVSPNEQEAFANPLGDMPMPRREVFQVRVQPQTALGGRSRRARNLGHHPCHGFGVQERNRGWTPGVGENTLPPTHALPRPIAPPMRVGAATARNSASLAKKI